MRRGAWLLHATTCGRVQSLSHWHSVLTFLHIPCTMHPSVCYCNLWASGWNLAPVDCVLALHKSQSMRECTGGHDAGHVRTTSQPTQTRWFLHCVFTSRASFKRSVVAQIACLRSANQSWNIRKWCYFCISLTNVCNRRHTGSRTCSNHSKNFASTTGEIVNSGDWGRFLKERCLVTACHCV